MQHPGTVLIQAAANTVATKLERRRITATLRRLAIRGKTTGGGQATGARTGTQYRDSCSDQQHIDDIGAHGTAPLGMVLCKHRRPSPRVAR